jgi:outer membrane immunogenic protein
MKALMGGAVGLAALVAAGAAGAADLPMKAPPMMAPPVYSWTGFYVGLNVGAAINDSSHTLDPAGCFLVAGLCGIGPAVNPLRTFSGDFDDIGFTGGGQIGYNYQFAPAWVAGIELDFNYNGLRDSDSAVQALAAPLVGTFSYTVDQNFDWFGTVRGRLGWLPTPTFLLYATGGLAYGHVDSSTFAVFSAAGDTYVGSASDTRFGWTVGGGAEWAFGGNWTVKAEYLYVDLGSFSYNNACVTPALVCTATVPPPAYTTTIDTREHIVRVGVNLKFP